MLRALRPTGVLAISLAIVSPAVAQGTRAAQATDTGIRHSQPTSRPSDTTEALRERSAPPSSEQTVRAAATQTVGPGFVQNQGHWDSHAKFRLGSGNKVVWVTATGLLFEARSAAAKNDAARTSVSERLSFAETFIGANPNPATTGATPQPCAHL